MALPRSGIIESINGAMHGVWRDRQGRRQCWPIIMEGAEPKQYADGRPRVRYKASTYYGKAGGIVVPLHVRDKSAGRTMVTELDRRLDAARAGKIPMSEVRNIGRRVSAEPIADTITAYIESLKLAGVKRWAEAQSTLLRIAQGAGWRYIHDMTGESLTAHLQRQSLAKGTLGKHVQRAKAFANWLMKGGRLDRAPFGAVKTPRAQLEGERVHPRRAMDQTGIMHLIMATKARNADRALLYAVLATTGMRIDEAAKVLTSDYKDGWLTIRADVCKTNVSAKMPIRADIAVLLNERCQALNLKPTDKLLAVPKQGMNRLRGDLNAAGIPYHTDEGFFDRHSFRVSFATMLARNGVHLSLVMALMRHKPKDITSMIYIKFDEADKRAAVDALFEPGTFTALHASQ